MAVITNFFALSKNPALVEFRDYVLSFYGPDAPKTLYPIEGCTTEIVEMAIVVYFKMCSDPQNFFEWGDGDSLDRERVRDIILGFESLDPVAVNKEVFAA